MTSVKGNKPTTGWHLVKVFFVPAALCVWGVNIALGLPDDSRDAYVDAAVGGLWFIAVLIGIAAGLFLVFRLVTWPFRSRTPV